MKKKEKQTVVNMTTQELGKVLADARTALTILTMNRHTKQLKNVREGTALRRKIAVVSTLLRQKEITHE